MTELKAGDTFPEGVTFNYVPYLPENDAVAACGVPSKYDASAGMSAFNYLGGAARLEACPHRSPFSSPTGHVLTCLPEFKNEKIVLVAVPGAFTPTCQEIHFTGFLNKREEFKAKGVDHIVFIAANDIWVMAAWGKANGVKDDYIVSCP